MKFKNTIIFALFILLVACSNQVMTENGFKISNVPDDWEYRDCPDSEYLKCNLIFPLPKGFNVDLQGDNNNEAIATVSDKWINGRQIPPTFTIQWLGKYKYSFENIINCKDFQLQNGEICDLKLRYIKDFSQHKIMSYQAEDSPQLYLYILKLQNGDTYFIRGYADEESIHLIDTSILNVKVL